MMAGESGLNSMDQFEDYLHQDPNYDPHACMGFDGGEGHFDPSQEYYPAEESMLAYIPGLEG